MRRTFAAYVEGIVMDCIGEDVPYTHIVSVFITGAKKPLANRDIVLFTHGRNELSYIVSLRTCKQLASTVCRLVS